MSTPAATTSVRPAEPRIDVLDIVSGALGPVPKCSLRVAPLTVFIGAQGSGKSLIAQVLYAMEELPFLLYIASLERGMSRKSDAEAFRWVLDRLRSPDRAFATFASPSVKLRWRRGARDEWPEFAPATLDFSAHRANRRVIPSKKTAACVGELREQTRAKGWSELHHAIYFPTERLAIAGRRTQLAGKAFPQPITYDLFEHWLEEHAAVAAADWADGRPPDALGRDIDVLGAAALRGRARKHGDRWKWEFGEGRGRLQFDLDLASSGQRANFSIPYLARALASLRGTGDVASDLSLYIEEPELSLHPAAQREMVRLLALLVNAGFRIVVTTHSLTLVYAINNLLQAGRLTHGGPGVPRPDMRLRSQDVAVYALTPGEVPRPLLDVETAFIDEGALGSVGEDLSAELSRIGNLLPPEGG